MRTPHRRQVLTTGFAAATLLSGSGLVRIAWAAVRGTVVAVINTATSKKPDGEPAALAPGATIEDGVEIATGKDSALELSLAQGGAFVLGARSSAALSEGAAVLMERGRFRYRAAAGESYGLATPTLDIVQTAADFVVEVRDNGDTLCGVLKGTILCTSKRTGRAAKVAAGQSVVWASGSFGGGVTEGVYRTGDVAVDDSMDAARAKYAPPPPPELPVPPQTPPIPPPPNPQ